MQQQSQVESIDPPRVYIFEPDYGSLEWVQLGLDALASMPPAIRKQFASGESFLHRQKAVLEAKYIP